MFLYRHVLEGVIAPDQLGKFELLRSSRPTRLPTVLAADEVVRVLAAIPPQRISRLMMGLLYGTGMRVGECCTLRVRDIDLGRAQIIVRAAKGTRIVASCCRRAFRLQHTVLRAARWCAERHLLRGPDGAAANADVTRLMKGF